MVEVIGGNYAVKHLPCFCQRAFEMEETLGIVMIKIKKLVQRVIVKAETFCS